MALRHSRPLLPQDMALAVPLPRVPGPTSPRLPASRPLGLSHRLPQQEATRQDRPRWRRLTLQQPLLPCSWGSLPRFIQTPVPPPPGLPAILILRTRARRYVCARARTHTRLLSHCMFLFWGFPPRERELAERGASGRAGHAAGPRSSPPSGALRLGAVGWSGVSDVAGAWSPVVKGLAVWVPRVRLITAWAVSGTKNRSHPGGNHL